jgi:hypothetical protein
MKTNCQRKIGRHQRCNKKSYIEAGQTDNEQNKKDKRTYNDLQNITLGNRSWTHFRNTGVQPLFVWFVLLNLFFDVVFSISFKHFLLSSHIRICRATYFYFQLILWDSYYSIFSFLCNVLKIIVCPFATEQILPIANYCSLVTAAG